MYRRHPLSAFPVILSVVLLDGCAPRDGDAPRDVPQPDHVLTTETTHNRFSSAIPPTLRVASGAVVEVHTKEASDGQLTVNSQVDAVSTLDFDPIHPLTGPIYVETAEPGDVLAVTIHDIQIGDWGWIAIAPGFGFLADVFPNPYLKTISLPPGATEARFTDGVTLPLSPFAGVMGVAPATDSMLSTIPPRANGGNLDNKHIKVGTTAYFPVFVEGALFSIGDTHAVQGDGEISGTALEAPMRLIIELHVLKGGRPIEEPQYETDEYYAVTAFGTTIDEAARKASLYMIDYLVAEHGLDRTDAYVLSSLAGDLKIAETVDVPHMLVAMHMPKDIFR
ncbi:MAG: acetamidase/formamidase family protein [Gemmatimonadetes bacterium]|nr:acetamidase/formamidase family protein [Gemmatimonadota bacterium]